MQIKIRLLISLILGLSAASTSSVFAAGDAEAGKAKAGVCAACHGVEGISSIPSNPNLAGQVPGYIEKWGISACMSCHGPSGHGIPKNYPRVAGQHKEYLEAQLLAYKKGERVGYNDIMKDIAFGLSELQIKQLSLYMAGLN